MPSVGSARKADHKISSEIDFLEAVESNEG